MIYFLGKGTKYFLVFYYEGLKSCKKLTTAELVKIFTEHDVVLTTYPILSSEIHHAKPVPDRSMRAVKKYVAEKSPLVEVCWWRVYARLILRAL